MTVCNLKHLFSGRAERTISRCGHASSWCQSSHGKPANPHYKPGRDYNLINRITNKMLPMRHPFPFQHIILFEINYLVSNLTRRKNPVKQIWRFREMSARCLFTSLLWETDQGTSGNVKSQCCGMSSFSVEFFLSTWVWLISCYHACPEHIGKPCSIFIRLIANQVDWNNNSRWRNTSPYLKPPVSLNF